jgi:hypothetical protein
MSSVTTSVDHVRASRRAVVRGAAWTVPVIATVATAPAFAASPIPCPVIPPARDWDGTTWRGTPSAQADSNDWNKGNNKWVIWKDNASTRQSLTFETLSPYIPVRPGATYEGSYTFWFQYGNQKSVESSAGTFRMYINGVQVGAALSTKAPGMGSPLTTTTKTFSYKVPADTKQIVIMYRYEIAARSDRRQVVSDDIEVGVPTFGTCRI